MLGPSKGVKTYGVLTSTKSVPGYLLARCETARQVNKLPAYLCCRTFGRACCSCANLPWVPLRSGLYPTAASRRTKMHCRDLLVHVSPLLPILLTPASTIASHLG
ncbi:hypothetical protein BO78DRAFT_174640 [Aspergillus sclerotiicarbonarius CBS 121057]|uniref:Uncharacterized protein n=1 Tax=Aspergillus sclerotiicarbonarius (strain CBS 121057 / IBT 28362) TaxID=1448318 RepID=A0A319E2D9_ASPSB|nr:hypothetical protein BO78DRAFT_174640 [Aspergillus sclerotiicarbonarius CBS 121057]